MDGVDHSLGNLCAGAVIEEDKPRLLVERRKGQADSFAWKSNGLRGNLLLVDHVSPVAFVILGRRGRLPPAINQAARTSRAASIHSENKTHVQIADAGSGHRRIEEFLRRLSS